MATKTLQIGSSLPDFNLPSIDGKYYSPASLVEKSALIIIFSCNHCPYVQAYEQRIMDIQKDYETKGVAIVAINSNDAQQYPEDSFEQMKVRANEKLFNFIYLRDEDQSIAAKFDAAHTPEIFLFDSKRKLVYHGKIDDNWQDEQKVKSKYLRNALDELLNGKEISVPETYSIGCTIKWKRQA
ncbi:MAG: thioredoxin family protein [Ignavibacteriaceae bacterium]|nr:thioredoxin family protein [Ignavibacteriaceae bacterium]